MSISSLKEKYPDLVVSMRKAAVLAGLEILDVYAQSDFGIQIKSDESPLTLADLRADKAIATTLAELVPDIPIVSEETYTEGDRQRDAIFFLVDPLDGTKEFIKKTGEFTVNIALIVQGKAALGVVYVPVSGDLFYRDLDGLSYVESDASRVERRGQIAQINSRAVDGQKITAVKSASHSNEETEAFLRKYNPVQSKSAGSSLKFCLIARGAADLYPRLGRTMEWDTGAAHAVLKGAGGNVYRIDTFEELEYGKEVMDNPHFVAASNGLKLTQG